MKKTTSVFWILICLLSAPLLMLAQEDNKALDQGGSKPPKKERKVDRNILPVIAANPTVGVLFGVLPGFNWNMGTEADTRNSTALAGFYYTTQKQLFTSIRSNAFTKGDGFNLLTDLRFNLNSQPTYGLGSVLERSPIVGGDDEVSDNPYKKVPNQEMMAFNNFRLYQTVQKRFKKPTFFMV